MRSFFLFFSLYLFTGSTKSLLVQGNSGPSCKSVGKSILKLSKEPCEPPRSFQRYSEVTSSNLGTTVMSEKSVHGGSSSIAVSTFNLAKTILGAGVLSLPFGVAAFTDSAKGLIPASLLLIVLGAASAYSFSSIGRACAKHNVKTFSEAWGKTVDEKSRSVLTFIIAFKTFFSCLAYSIIIGDSISQLIHPFLPNQRSNVILSLTSLIIFPLTLLRRLDALKYSSIIGLAGTLYTAIFMAIRYFDGSYRVGGKFFTQLTKPIFNQMNGPLVSILRTTTIIYKN